MKNVIIIIGSILLSILIFKMIVGNEPNSLKNSSKNVMEKSIEAMQRIP